jgi:predicted  nucleic acid-binding Zn-ribbon protein
MTTIIKDFDYSDFNDQVIRFKEDYKNASDKYGCKIGVMNLFVPEFNPTYSVCQKHIAMRKSLSEFRSIIDKRRKKTTFKTSLKDLELEMSLDKCFKLLDEMDNKVTMIKLDLDMKYNSIQNEIGDIKLKDREINDLKTILGTLKEDLETKNETIRNLELKEDQLTKSVEDLKHIHVIQKVKISKLKEDYEKHPSKIFEMSNILKESIAQTRTKDRITFERNEKILHMMKEIVEQKYPSMYKTNAFEEICDNKSEGIIRLCSIVPHLLTWGHERQAREISKVIVNLLTSNNYLETMFYIKLNKEDLLRNFVEINRM